MFSNQLRDNALTSCGRWFWAALERLALDDVTPMEFSTEVLRSLVLPPALSHWSDEALSMNGFSTHVDPENRGGIWRECKHPDAPIICCLPTRQLLCNCFGALNARICDRGTERRQPFLHLPADGHFKSPGVDIAAEGVFLAALRRMHKVSDWSNVATIAVQASFSLTLVVVS